METYNNLVALYGDEKLLDLIRNHANETHVVGTGAWMDETTGKRIELMTQFKVEKPMDGPKRVKFWLTYGDGRDLFQDVVPQGVLDGAQPETANWMRSMFTKWFQMLYQAAYENLGLTAFRFDTEGARKTG